VAPLRVSPDREAPAGMAFLDGASGADRVEHRAALAFPDEIRMRARGAEPRVVGRDDDVVRARREPSGAGSFRKLRPIRGSAPVVRHRWSDAPTRRSVDLRREAASRERFTTPETSVRPPVESGSRRTGSSTPTSPAAIRETARNERALPDYPRRGAPSRTGRFEAAGRRRTRRRGAPRARGTGVSTSSS
jgi:hypothetical protein